MMDYITGTIIEKSPERVVLEAGGIGISLQITFSTYQQLGQVGSRAKLLTHLQFREPSFDLYGFASSSERDVFRLLIQVSGVGVKVARTILSGINPRDVRDAILNNDVARLSCAPGIGKKTAERICVFLRDKALQLTTQREPGTSGADDAENDALAALESLGIPASKARPVIRKLIERHGSSIAVDELVRGALKSLF
ncbi:MAG: Holliday junction branch migration protein RuvA [Candidatus Coatesbacteria bacterium]|nr:Holliday junction branch migration protein RuvA [Candidatus Coatesbacteria bacterium]